MANPEYALVPRHYTLALDGSVQRITAGVNIDGTAWSSAPATENIWVDQVTFQNSNASAQTVFIGYKDGNTAPGTLDKTRAALDLSPGQSGGDQIFKSNASRQRGTQINVRYLYAKGTAGDYLHILVPQVGNITFP